MTKYWGYRAAEALACALPRPVAYAAAVAWVHVLLLLSPGRFHGLRDNLAHVVGETSARRLRALVRANARNLGRSWVDVLRMPRTSPAAPGAHLEGLDHLSDALSRGRGVVMVSAHLGPWDAGLVAFNANTGRMAVLAEVVRPHRLFEHLRRSRSRLGVSVIPVDVAAMRESSPDAARRIGAASLRRVVSELRGNGAVAIAIDRDLAGTGVTMPFFGQPASIPAGVVDIAIRCNAALMPAWSVRHRGRLLLYGLPPIPYDPSAPRDAEVLRVTSGVLAAFEEVIAANPDQWHVLDPIWPAAPQVRTRSSVLRHAPLLVALFCAALTAAGMSGWGLGLTSFTTTSDWWVRPAVGSGLAAVALLLLPRALLWARVNRVHFLAALGKAAMSLTTVALVTGLSGVLLGALRG